MAKGSIVRAADRVAVWHQAAEKFPTVSFGDGSKSSEDNPGVVTPPQGASIPNSNKFKTPANGLKKVLENDVDFMPAPKHQHPAVKAWTDSKPDFTKTYFKPEYQDALKSHLGEDNYNKLLHHMPKEHHDALHTHQQAPPPKNNKFTQPASALKKVLESPHTETAHVSEWLDKHPQFQKTYLQPKYQDALKGHLGDKSYNELQEHLKAAQQPAQGQHEPFSADELKKVHDDLSAHGEKPASEIHPAVQEVGKALGFNPSGKWVGMSEKDVKNALQEWTKTFEKQPEKQKAIQQALDKHWSPSDVDDINAIKSEQPQKSFGHAVQEAFPDVFNDDKVEAVNQKTPEQQKQMLQNTINSKPEHWDKLNKLHNDFFGEDAYNPHAAKKELAQQMAKYHGTDPGEYKEWLDTLDNDDLKDLKDNPAKAGYAHSDYMNGQDYDVDYDPEYDPESEEYDPYTDPDNDEYEGAEDEPEDNEVEDHPGFDPHSFVNDYKKAFPNTTWGYKELGGDPENAKNILQGIIDEPEEEGLGHFDPDDEYEYGEDEEPDYANQQEYDEHYDQWMADKLKAQQLYDKHFGDGGQPEERQPQSLGQKMQAINPNINAEVFDKQSPEGQKDILQNIWAKDPKHGPAFQQLYDDHYGDIDEINNIKQQQGLGTGIDDIDELDKWLKDTGKIPQEQPDQHQSLAQGIKSIFPNTPLPLDQMSTPELKKTLEDFQEHLAETPGHADNVAKLKALYDQHFGDGDIDAIKSQMPDKHQELLDKINAIKPGWIKQKAWLENQDENNFLQATMKGWAQHPDLSPQEQAGFQKLHDEYFGNQGLGDKIKDVLTNPTPDAIEAWNTMDPEQAKAILNHLVTSGVSSPELQAKAKELLETHDFGQQPSSEQYTGAEPLSAEELTKGLDWGDQKGPSWSNITATTGLSKDYLQGYGYPVDGSPWKPEELKELMSKYNPGSDTHLALQKVYDDHFGGSDQQDHPHAGTNPHAYPGASFADLTSKDLGSWPAGLTDDNDDQTGWQLKPGVGAFLESQGYGPKEFSALPWEDQLKLKDDFSGLDPEQKDQFAAQENQGDQDEISQIKQQMPQADLKSVLQDHIFGTGSGGAVGLQNWLDKSPEQQKAHMKSLANGVKIDGQPLKSKELQAKWQQAYDAMYGGENDSAQKPQFDLQPNGVPTAKQLEAWGVSSGSAINISTQDPELFESNLNWAKSNNPDGGPWSWIGDALKDHDWPLQGGDQQKITPENFDAQKYAEEFADVHGIDADIIAGSVGDNTGKVKNMTYDQAKKDLKFNMDYEGWTDPEIQEKHQALWDKYFGDQQDGSSSPVIDKTQTPNKKELMDAGLGNYMADGLSKQSPEDFWKSYEDMKGHASPGSVWDAVHKHFEGQSGDGSGIDKTKTPTTQELMDAGVPESLANQLSQKSPGQFWQDYEKTKTTADPTSAWGKVHKHYENKPKQPKPSAPPQFDPQTFAEQYKEILPGSSSSLAAGTVTPEKAQEKLKELIEGNPGTAKTKKLQELHDQWFGSTPGATPKKKTPAVTGSPHYKSLMQRVDKAPQGAFSEADLKKFKSKKFKDWFDKAPQSYRETLQSNPGIVIEDFDAKSYSAPVGGGEWGDSLGKDKYYDVMGYPKTKKDYELPKYLRQNDPRSDKVKFPPYEDEQETLPLSPGEKFAPHYGPLPIYRVLNLDLDHKVDSSRAPSSLKTDKERKLWAEQQNSRLQRIDTILNGDKAGRTPEQTMQGLKNWGKQYNLTDKEVNDVASTLMGQQGDLFADDKWDPIKELSAKHPEIDMSEFHDLAQKLDITTPTESKGNYDHPELGTLILDYLENTKHRSSEGGKDSEGGLGWHWTRAINKMYKGVPAASMGQDKMRATDRKVPVAISGLWSGQGEGEGHGQAFDPFDSGSRELEHNLYSHAPVNVRRLQIRAPSAENQGYGTWHDTIDHGPMSTWSPGRYEEGDEFRAHDYAPGERVDYKPSLAKELDKAIGGSHDASFDKLTPGHKADALFTKLIHDHPEQKEKLGELYRDFFVGRPDLPTKPHQRRASLQKVADSPVVPIDCGEGYSYNWQTDECESGLCPDGSYFDAEHDVCTPYPQSACPPGYLYNDEHGVCEIIPDNEIEDAQEVTARKRQGILSMSERMR